MARVLILATTTGYQTRSFGEAAERLGVELVFATDRCHMIDDPWRDAAIPIRFYDEEASVQAIVASAGDRRIDGVLAVGDRPTVIAARAASALGLPWHSPEGAEIARNKLRTRERLRDAGLPVPLFVPFRLGTEMGRTSLPPPTSVPFPCVVKPAALSASRGVIRADDPESLAAAAERLRALMGTPEIRAERDPSHDIALVESFIPGREYAVEALMHEGRLNVFAIFDKPDPLDGPFFEETIYVTPPPLDADAVAVIERAVERAAHAIGLAHGPVHAECRVNADGVYVIEVAARPIGGLCARALRFGAVHRDSGLGIRKTAPDSRIANPDVRIPLEELLLRHALGESPAAWQREPSASGVMMIPIPRRGVLRGVTGVDAAQAVPFVDGIHITAKTDQMLVPLPEGASYLGFIFARAARPADVDRALREAYAQLQFVIDPELVVRASA